MPLNDLAIKSLQAAEKKTRHWDSGGLYLEVTITGSKLWRMKFRFGGKEKVLSFGTYPTVTLKQARLKRDEARLSISRGIDPSEARKAVKTAFKRASEGNFESVAREWFSKQSSIWVKSHSEKIIRRLELDVFPWIGNRMMDDISAPDLLTIFRRIENRGALDTAHRASQTCSQIFRYGIATGKAIRNPVSDLQGALSPVRQNHFATITNPMEIGALLRAIDDYKGAYVTRYALQLAPLVFLRPGELRHGEWSEINFDSAQWKISAEKMKARSPHIVPLSKQALAILEDVQPLTHESRYIFPSARSFHRPMSENAVLAALRRMGFRKDEITGHGFRSMASTLLNESGKWSRDAIERQLAHGERNKVRAAYNHAEYLTERTEMIQWWADHLDSLKNAEKQKG
ncbi:MAG: integrase arm-type DNA-binding domain-containing protein [Magnetococcus sp. THC-1_WYH]